MILRGMRCAWSGSMLKILVVLLACAPDATLGKKKKGKAESTPEFVKGITERTVPLRTHSLYAPYVDSDLQNRYFDFGGDAYVDTSKHVRLTQDRPSQSGWLWSRLPLTPTQWEIEFEFRVDGKSNALYGDGFAVWLTRERAQTGSVFGSSDHWQGLGIFFDTYANARHSYVFPEVLAMINDGTKSYDHDRDGAGQEIGRCSIDYRRTEITAKAKLTYFKNQFLELQLQTEQWDEWTTCFTVFNVTLPASPYLGFTSHTGDVSDDHDIIQISTANVVYHPPHIGQTLKASRTMGFAFFGWIFWFMKWVVLAVIFVVAATAARGFMARKNAKRF